MSCEMLCSEVCPLPERVWREAFDEDLLRGLSHNRHHHWVSRAPQLEKGTVQTAPPTFASAASSSSITSASATRDCSTLISLAL